MSIISVSNLSHSFGGKALFKDANFVLQKGEHIGLVGANGKGKSTFMKIMAQEFEADSADVYVNPKYRIGYMDQHTKLKDNRTIMDTLKEAFSWMIDLESEMISIYENLDSRSDLDQAYDLERAGDISNILTYNNYYNIDDQIKYVAAGLGVEAFGYDTFVNNLSGGQRTKILLCKLLLANPDVLLLDEPTNFLDEEHIEWLRQYLLKYENAFAIISHDIPFLNSIIDTVWHFEDFKITKYKGNYDHFIRTYELEKDKLEKSFKRQQDKIENIQKFIDKNIARASTSSRAKSRQKMLDKIERIELSPNMKPAIFNFVEKKAPVKNVLQIKNVVLGYETPLSSAITIDVMRHEKIVIIGANGIGKSTLLKTLIEQIKPLEGTVIKGDYVNFGYFKQEEKFDNLTAYEYAFEHFPYEKKTQQDIRRELGKVGLIKDHVNSRVSNLSGGEQAKLRLAILMNNDSNVLVLDEPTNHLDKESKANFKKALIDYPGTLIFVCHEPEFYQGLATVVYDASEWVANN